MTTPPKDAPVTEHRLIRDLRRADCACGYVGQGVNFDRAADDVERHIRSIEDAPVTEAGRRLLGRLPLPERDAALRAHDLRVWTDAILAIEAEAADKIDAETLRQAMRGVPMEDGWTPGEPGWTRGRTPEEVAAEYARLRSEQGERTTSKPSVQTPK